MVPIRISAPLLTAFVLFLGIIANSARLRRRDERARHDAAPAPSVRELIVTAVGGYAMFLGIVLLFHVTLAGERGAMTNALTNGTLLAFVAPSAFIVLSWAERKLRRRTSCR